MPRLEQRGKVLRRQFAETVKVRVTGKGIDANEADGPAERGAQAQVAEQLNEIELIEEIVFEPEYELVEGRVIIYDFTPPSEVIPAILSGGIRPEKKPGSHVHQLVVGKTSGHRALMEWISPDRPHARDSSQRKRVRNGRSVGDVKDLAHGP
jgi:hypothetical protein